MPQENIIILQKIAALLRRVAKYEHINKMSLSNLALVFGPNVLRPERDLDPISMLRDTPVINEVMQIFITADAHMEELIQRKFSPSLVSPRRGNPNFNAKRLQRSGPNGGIPQWQTANGRAIRETAPAGAGAGWQSGAAPSAAVTPVSNMTSTFGSQTITFSLEDTLGASENPEKPPTFVDPRLSVSGSDSSQVQSDQPSPRRNTPDFSDRKARRGGKFDSNQVKKSLEDDPNFPEVSPLSLSGRAIPISSTSSDPTTPTGLRSSNSENALGAGQDVSDKIPSRPVTPSPRVASPPPVGPLPAVPVIVAPPQTDRFEAMEQEISSLKVSVKALEAALAIESKARKELESKMLLLMTMQST